MKLALRLPLIFVLGVSIFCSSCTRSDQASSASTQKPDVNAAVITAKSPLRQRQLKGSVFVVTKGGQSIKLALADVVLLDRSAREEMMSQLKAKAVGVRAAVLKEAEPLLNRKMEAQKAIDSWTPRWEKYRTIEAKDKITDAQRELESVDSQISEINDRLGQEAAEADLETPSAAPRTRTNADGAFTIVVPDEGYAILIQASREVPREKYRWLARVDGLVPDGDVVLFSNHNLFKVGAESKN